MMIVGHTYVGNLEQYDPVCNTSDKRFS